MNKPLWSMERDKIIEELGILDINSLILIRNDLDSLIDKRIYEMDNIVKRKEFYKLLEKC